MVSHPPKSSIDTICENIKNAYFSKLKKIEFNKLGREEKNMIEESFYAMMDEFKKTPLQLDNTMPKELYEIVENKWHYCLKMEKEIREFTLAQVMPNLKRGKIKRLIRNMLVSLHPNIEPSAFFRKRLKMLLISPHKSGS